MHAVIRIYVQEINIFLCILTMDERFCFPYTDGEINGFTGMPKGEPRFPRRRVKCTQICTQFITHRRKSS